MYDRWADRALPIDGLKPIGDLGLVWGWETRNRFNVRQNLWVTESEFLIFVQAPIDLDHH